MKTKIIYILILLFAFTNAYGQEKQEKREEYCAEIAFALGSSVLNAEIGTNKATLASFTQNINELLQDSTVTIEKITITSKASPEGGVAYNKHITQKRSNSVRAYIKEHINIPETLFVINNIGTEWNILQDLVAESNIEKKSEILYIINNVPEETWVKVKSTDRWLTLTDSRNKHLMDLHFGIPYRQMEKDIFPEMRSSSIATIYYRCKETQTAPKEEIIIKEEQKAAKPTEPKKQTEPKEPTASETATTPLSTCEPDREKKPLFALKTNLLYLGAGVINIGVEIPLGRRFTLDLPFIYSPYTISKNWNIRVLTLQPEFRYWLKDQFEGHFLGVHAHGGYYNIGIGDKTRYQDTNGDTPFYGFGASYGYALNLNERWGMSFTGGFGYARFNSDLFYNIDNGAKFDNKVVDYWGITKLGVNLIYKIR